VLAASTRTFIGTDASPIARSSSARPYLELFARPRHGGWQAWGDELAHEGSARRRGLASPREGGKAETLDAARRSTSAASAVKRLRSGWVLRPEARSWLPRCACSVRR